MWKVTVSKSNQFDNESLLLTAASEPPGLIVTVYAWEVLDAVVASDTGNARQRLSRTEQAG